MLLLTPEQTAFLDLKVQEYNQPGFIAQDPISIPHLFTSKQDIEIMGFFASILAWGQRKTIIQKCTELIDRLDGTPYLSLLTYSETTQKKLLGFVHRTFQESDLLYFTSRLHHHYQCHESLETAFSQFLQPEDMHIEPALVGFKNYFFEEEHLHRTRKHLASPLTKSACKRLCMFLRWMVREDRNGVDFGLWKSIKPSQLVCPCDVHVERVARQLQLVTRTQTDWAMALELTANLRALDPWDPVKYDFALFGLGLEERYGS